MTSPALAKARDLGLARMRSFAALIGILLLAILISPTASDGSRIFLQAGNLTDILRQISLIGIISLAMTFVILTGGIDLSVGSVLALSTSITAMALTRWMQGSGYGVHIAAAILAALACSTAAGALNGAVIATVRVQPFVVSSPP
jgi:ribose/xylose/arabinose/galactoside ABC-type transport system permease subunit